MGSGKTSVVLQLAKYLVGGGTDRPAKLVIIENEIGETGIDDKVLSGAGYEVQGLFSGCVCCTLSGELVNSFRKIIKDIAPEYLVMEATGVAAPANIKETLARNLNLDCKICCVTDAKRWPRLLNAMKNMVRDQLDAADLILINKTDLVDADTLAAVEESLKTYNNQAGYFQVSAKAKIDDSVWQALLQPVRRPS